jgi:transposase
MAKRKRRKFTPEFKAETVKLIRESGRSIGEICRELDLTETAVRSWVRQAEVDAGRGPEGAMTSTELEEFRRLRRENRELRQEREILKKNDTRFKGSSQRFRVGVNVGDYPGFRQVSSRQGSCEVGC